MSRGGGPPSRGGRLVRGVVSAAATAVIGHALPSVCVLGQWSPVPLRALPRGWCRWRGPADSHDVALTFDDGPSPQTTPATLDLLDELGMRATFFVLGILAEAHGDLVNEIRRRGHTVGLHGYRHEHHLLRTPGWIRRDVAESAAAIEALGIRPRWFRPPYGQLTATTIVEARRHGMDVVLWSAWGHEWDEPDAAAVMRRVAPGLGPGAIVLLHDTDVSAPPGTAARTHASLPLLAEALRVGGWRAVTVDDLLMGSQLHGLDQQEDDGDNQVAAQREHRAASSP